ncbi:MAG TPA: hypothetical protein VE198_25330 [Actinoallomurus sp.]|nr:hypothetical protein [Actinoallomurus sp.]
MPAILPSTKTSLAQRLSAHAKRNRPQLTTVHVRYRASFAYIDGELADGEILPLMRLRYGGSAHHWGLAIHQAAATAMRTRSGSPAAPKKPSTSSATFT